MLSLREMTELAKALGSVVRDQLGKAVAEIRAEIERVNKRIDELPKPESLPDISALVRDAVAALPPPQDGKSVSADDVLPLVERLVSETVNREAASLQQRIDALPKPQALPDIAGLVRDALAALPKPQDGKSVTLEDLRGMVELEISKGLLDMERRGQGVLERAVERIPKPRDGVDGLGFDDLSIEQDGPRNFAVVFQRGDQQKRFEFSIPAMIYRGVFDGGEHEPGDTVTFGGSLWCCDERTSDKPGEPGSKGWRLAAKRGRDGKPGRDLGPRVPQPIKVS